MIVEVAFHHDLLNIKMGILLVGIMTAQIQYESEVEFVSTLDNIVDIDEKGTRGEMSGSDLGKLNRRLLHPVLAFYQFKFYSLIIAKENGNICAVNHNHSFVTAT
jgi:hypothetical protein